MSPEVKGSPSELELLILKVLWNAESRAELPLAVREIRERLKTLDRDLAHTSVITTLNIMVKKKFAKRRKHKNAFLFSPIVSLQDVSQKEVTTLLNRVFDGSAEHLLLALFDSNKVDAEQIAEMKKLINQKAKQIKAD